MSFNNFQYWPRGFMLFQNNQYWWQISVCLSITVLENWLFLLVTWFWHFVLKSHTNPWFISCFADHAIWHFIMHQLRQHMDSDPSSRSLLTWGRMFRYEYETDLGAVDGLFAMSHGICLHVRGGGGKGKQ